MHLTPVPVAVRNHLGSNTHPGLLLDKYIPSWEEGASGDFSSRVQKPAVEDVVKLSHAPPPLLDLNELTDRRQHFLEQVRAACCRCVTSGPLTLHLARASVLENAGTCLHPLYGFAYLPGSGLKGLARAYATTAANASASDVEAVFGTTEGGGRIVFHDAWPVKWPRLAADIVNSHHKEYYGAREGDTNHPPGDWEAPNMVSFLVVPAGVAFDFPLSKRRDDAKDDAFLELARKWLLGGLVYLGAGAKTAAGYGSFRPLKECPAVPPLHNRAAFEATPELVTPAFLAGPNQQAADCELRSATLRGLLRWWWRTMHAGFVDVATLRRMEAAVWGDTRAGGAVRVTVEPAAVSPPTPYLKAQVTQRNQLVAPPPQQATQGLWYHSYGMDEKKGQRFFLAPESRWRIQLTARASRLELLDGRGNVRSTHPLTAESVLRQARLALGLLCHLGGAGSKSRKGFGSFTDLPGFTLDELREAASSFRKECRVSDSFQPAQAASLALEQIVAPPQQPAPWLEVVTPWRNAWFALDQVGYAAQAFAQSLAHNAEKLALGLPRQIHGPRPQPMPHQQRSGKHRPPQQLHGVHGDRHAAPVFYHLARNPDGTLTVRVTAFVARDLKNANQSRTLLTRLLAALQTDLGRRILQYASQGVDAPGAPPGGGGAAPPAASQGKRPHGTPVKVKILRPLDKGGGFRVQEAGRPEGTLNQGTAPPTPPAVGTNDVDAFVYNDDPRHPQYRWDKPAAAPPRPQLPGRGRGPNRR